MRRDARPKSDCGIRTAIFIRNFLCSIAAGPDCLNDDPSAFILPPGFPRSSLSHSRVKFNWNPRAKLREYWTKLRELRDAPHAIAGGVAIGVFWGFTPLTGFKTLLSMATARLCRWSILAAVIVVSLHDVISPLWPLILRWEYQLGFWILSRPHHFPPELHVHKLQLAHLFNWKTVELLWPTFIGSCIVGLPLAVVSYWIAFFLLQRYEAKHHRHLKTPV